MVCDNMGELFEKKVLSNGYLTDWEDHFDWR